MSSNAYRTAIIQLIAQLRARGQSGQYILYQVMPDELADPLTVDMDHVIELGEKYPDDQSMMDLLEQALDVINQAEQAAAQSVA